MLESNDESNELQAQVSLLKQENQELKQKLVAFKSLDEELAAKKLFDLAYKRLQTYLAIGGIFTLIAGFVGYKSVVDFIDSQATAVAKRMDSTQVTQLAIVRLDKQVSNISRKELKRLNQNLNDSANNLFKIISNKIITLNQTKTVTQETQASVSPVRNNVMELPKKVDLSNLAGPVGNQGSEGSVVGFVLADALSATYMAQKQESLRFSPRFIYNSISTSENSGASITAGLALLRQKGAVLEKAWPYVSGQYNSPPPSDLAKAQHFKIRGFQSAEISVPVFEKLITNKNFISCGITMYQEFYSPDKNNVLPAYTPTFHLTGAFAANIVGYDDITHLMKLRFSWGNDFGANGYVYLAYADLNKVITQAYVIEAQ